MAYTLRVCAGSIQIQFTDYNYKGAEKESRRKRSWVVRESEGRMNLIDGKKLILFSIFLILSIVAMSKRMLYVGRWILT